MSQCVKCWMCWSISLISLAAFVGCGLGSALPVPSLEGELLTAFQPSDLAHSQETEQERPTPASRPADAAHDGDSGTAVDAAALFQARCAFCHAEAADLADKAWMIDTDLGQVSPPMAGMTLSTKEAFALRNWLWNMADGGDSSGGQQPGESEAEEPEEPGEEPVMEEPDEKPPAAEEPPFGSNFLTDCGNRSVSMLPLPGYIRQSITYDAEVEPANSPLLGPILTTMACGMTEFESDFGLLYEVDANGKVLSQVVLVEFAGQRNYHRTSPSADMRFVLEDGCLKLEGQNAANEPPAFDPINVPLGPCAAGQMVVGRNGPLYSSPTAEFICVGGESGSVCRDCWTADGAWHEEWNVDATYVALGDLDDVPLCGTDAGTGSIRSGDRVTIRMHSITTFRYSPSPEELGYEELTVPTWP